MLRKRNWQHPGRRLFVDAASERRGPGLRQICRIWKHPPDEVFLSGNVPLQNRLT